MFKRFKDKLINYYLPQVLADFIMLFSFDTIQKIGYYAGKLAMLAPSKTRRRGLQQIEYHLGLDKKAARKLAEKNVIKLVQGVCEFCWTRRAMREGIEKFIRFEDESKLQEIYARGKGILILSAHMGNWEWLAALAHQKGYKVGAVGKKLNRGGLTKLIMAMRAEIGMKVYARESNSDLRVAARDVMKRGYTLSLLSDQDEGKHGYPVRFFKYVTSAPKGIAMFAKMTGAPVLPIFVTKGADNRYIIRVLPEIEYNRDKLDDMEQWRLTQQVTAVIENTIRKYPDDWSWIQNRWKTVYNEEILEPIALN